MYLDTTEGGFMKKLICIFMCMIVLIGCSNKKEDSTITDENNQTEVTEGVQKESQDKTDYETYPRFAGIKTDEGSWYYDAPQYFNEVKLKLARSFLNGDRWWFSFAKDIGVKTNDLDEAYEYGLNAFYTGMDDYFWPTEAGFNPDKKELVNISGFDMYKVEGYIDNSKSTKGNSTNCWIYGYTFIIGGIPCSVMGLTYEDNSEEAKQDIMMYVDNMVQSFHIEK